MKAKQAIRRLLDDPPNPERDQDHPCLRVALVAMGGKNDRVEITRTGDGSIVIGTLPVPKVMAPEVLRWVGFFMAHDEEYRSALRHEHERRARMLGNGPPQAMMAEDAERNTQELLELVKRLEDPIVP
jgi:hypothetical protein